eukprot:15474568-Alexandrium_andersonii.AAC.1
MLPRCSSTKPISALAAGARAPQGECSGCRPRGGEPHLATNTARCKHNARCCCQTPGCSRRALKQARRGR